MGGYICQPDGGTPISRGVPSSAGWGTPIRKDGGTPCWIGWGTPIGKDGVPLPIRKDGGTPPVDQIGVCPSQGVN